VVKKIFTRDGRGLEAPIISTPAAGRRRTAIRNKNKNKRTKKAKNQKLSKKMEFDVGVSGVWFLAVKMTKR